MCVHDVPVQLMQRIESFKALKRQQIDQANRLEFYSTKHTDRGTCTCICACTLYTMNTHAVYMYVMHDAFINMYMYIRV